MQGKQLGPALTRCCAAAAPPLRLRDLLSPNGVDASNLKVTRRFKRKFEEINHVVAVSSSSFTSASKPPISGTSTLPALQHPRG
jgi:hypothetical protein